MDVISLLQPRDDLLYKVLDFIFIMGATLGKLSQPDFLSIPRDILHSEALKGYK